VPRKGAAQLLSGKAMGESERSITSLISGRCRGSNFAAFECSAQAPNSIHRDPETGDISAEFGPFSPLETAFGSSTAFGRHPHTDFMRAPSLPSAAGNRRAAAPENAAAPSIDNAGDESAAILALVDNLATLAADLWFAGKLASFSDDQEPPDANDD